MVLSMCAVAAIGADVAETTDLPVTCTLVKIPAGEPEGGCIEGSDRGFFRHVAGVIVPRRGWKEGKLASTRATHGSKGTKRVGCAVLRVVVKVAAVSAWSPRFGVGWLANCRLGKAFEP